MSSHRTTSLIVALALVGAAAPAVADAAPKKVTCRSVAVAETHGGRVAPGTHLTELRGGRVVAIDATSSAQRRLPFDLRGRRWVTTTTGQRLAVADQPLRRGGRVYVVAAATARDGSVLCAGGARAFASDTASYGSDDSLMSYGYLEANTSTRNVLGRPLGNWENRVLCQNTATHPDGAVLYSRPTPTTWCFKGRGAGLTNSRATDIRCPETGWDVRFETADHGTRPYVLHYITYTASTVLASKRPNAKPNGEILLNSAIAWRTVNPYLHYPAGFDPHANRVVQPPPPAPAPMGPYEAAMAAQAPPPTCR